MSALSSTAGPSGASKSVATLRSLACIRSRCKVVYEAAKSDQLAHFRLDLSKLDDVATFVQGKILSSTYNRRFPSAWCFRLDVPISTRAYSRSDVRRVHVVLLVPS